MEPPQPTRGRWTCAGQRCHHGLGIRRAARGVVDRRILRSVGSRRADLALPEAAGLALPRAAQAARPRPRRVGSARALVRRARGVRFSGVLVVVRAAAREAEHRPRAHAARRHRAARQQRRLPAEVAELRVHSPGWRLGELHVCAQGSVGRGWVFFSGVRLSRNAMRSLRSCSVRTAGFSFSSRCALGRPPFNIVSTASASVAARPSWK